MIDKDRFIDFLFRYFSGKEIKVQHFDSGSSMIDVYLDDVHLICAQIESTQIGISIVKNYREEMDLSTLPEEVFYSNKDGEAFLIRIAGAKAP